jgi:hypothetical protein
MTKFKLGMTNEELNDLMTKMADSVVVVIRH